MTFLELHESVQNLVTFLVTISLNSQKQKEIHGIGEPGYEMPEYFQCEHSYNKDIEVIKEQQLLYPDLINRIDNFIFELKKENETFWMNYATLPEWNNIRKKAYLLYTEIGLEELDIITKFEYDGRMESVIQFDVIEKK